MSQLLSSRPLRTALAAALALLVGWQAWTPVAAPSHHAAAPRDAAAADQAPAPSLTAAWPARPYAGAGDATGYRMTASGQIPMPAQTPAAHASSLLAMPGESAASVLAFWFAGQRESAPDVRIAFSWFDRAAQAWQPARFVVERAEAGAQLGYGIRRIGNPVAWRDADGRVHLFVVATGLGGWAAGRILHLVQAGNAPRRAAELNALRFDVRRVLPLSWLWNTSHLVRTNPLPLADGGMLLPIYFELGIKYPMALHMGPRGEFLGVQRISSRGDLLQPALLALPGGYWRALMRNHGPERRVALAGSDDGGQHWLDMPSLALPNPNASVAAISVGPRAQVLAYNPLDVGRHRLDIATSANAQDWHNVTSVALGHEGDEFSYPALAWADGQDGQPELWLSYTEQRQRIAWARFALAPQRAVPKGVLRPGFAGDMVGWQANANPLPTDMNAAAAGGAGAASAASAPGAVPNPRAGAQP